MIKRVFKITLSILIPVYLIIVFFIFDNKKDNEICKDISIVIKDSVESPFLKVKDVEKGLLKIKDYPVGKSFSEINTYEIKKELEKNKIIKNAVVYKTPSGTLNIDIFQRNPILRVMGINGDYYVDDNCEVMPVSYNFTAHLPIATGYVNNEIIHNGLFDFVMFIRKEKFWNSQIEQIHITSDGEAELIPRVGEHVILLGNFDNYEQKLNNLFEFYKQGLNKKGWNLYKEISLKYDKQVVGIK